MNRIPRTTWLEVALNGPWTRRRQPKIPVTAKAIIAAGVACAKAGAAIVHLHAYDEATGRQTEDPDVYARLIEGIRARVDVIVYPTIPTSGLEGQAAGQEPKQRYAHIEELARRGLIEWAVTDPGSTNFSLYDELRRNRPGFVYLNPEPDVRHALTLARRHRFHPSFAIYEPGFLRLGAALHARIGCPTPIYRFMFSTGYTFGFPPEDYGLTAYLALLRDVAPGGPWMVAGLQVDIRSMIPRVVAEGGHVRVGLEDAFHGCTKTNQQLIEQAAKAIPQAGGTLATARDVRAALAARH